MSIAEAYRQVLDSLVESAVKYGRDPKEIDLLPVSKLKPLEYLIEAFKAGASVLGENRIPEALEKKKSLPGDCEIDFIGHLQSNKASLTPGKFRLIHSLDSLKLASKLDRYNREAGQVQKVLIEVNTSGEESKGGYRNKEELFSDLEEILKLNNIKVMGMMTMAPWVGEEKIIRQTFSRCRELRNSSEREFDISLPILSMGMSGDYPWAIAEGSTLIRIGTSIFGSR